MVVLVVVSGVLVPVTLLVVVVVGRADAIVVVAVTWPSPCS